METLKTVNSIRLKLTKEQLWDLLTFPEWTEKYMFNCRVISDYSEGSSIDWKGEFQGVMAHLTGTVLEHEKLVRLKYSLIDPALSDPSVPENFVHVTYDIKPQDNETLLTVVNETFDGNEDRMKEITGGWEAFVFPLIQKIVETEIQD